jgi:5-methylcytosine-specific restriction protein A
MLSPAPIWMAAKFDNTDGRLRGAAGVARRLRIWTKSPYCAMCGRLTDYPDGFQVDHIVPLFKGGLDEDENLQVLDHECHDKKTLADMGAKERTKFDQNGRVVW